MTENPSDTVRAVFLAFVMVSSVMVGTVAFAGGAAADSSGDASTQNEQPALNSQGFAQQTPPPNDPGPDNRAADPNGSGEFPPGGPGYVFDGAVVFQGEEDITFGGALTDTLTGVSGDAEGQVLDTPIAQDQTLGRYSTDGSPGAPSVTVNRPRISNFEVLNPNDQDISGGSINENNAEDLTVVAGSNFEQAENLELTVENSEGLDITEEALDQGEDAVQAEGGDNQATWNVSLADVQGDQFNISVAGSDDLDFGTASQTTTIEVTGDDRVSIELDADTVTQGEDVTYEITGGVAGDYHLVTIADDEFRDNINVDQAASVFRNVGDVTERGVITGDDRSAGTYRDSDELGNVNLDNVTYSYAVVNIDDDDGLGVGSIETQYLDTSTVEVDVSTELTNVDARNQTEPFQAAEYEEDSADVTVEEGEVSLEHPTNTYVAGSEITVNGTAPAEMDEVAIYARDEGDFELVTISGQRTIDVDNDGTFSEDSVILSEGLDMLALPGTYRIGVIDASDADPDDDGTVDDTLTTSEFNTGTSNTRSLRVVGTSLNVSFPSLVRGQIATEDGDVTVEGSAPGSQEVLFIGIDERGGIVTQSVSVDDDGTFSEEDIAVADLAKGSVSLHVYSLGRDGEVGDGDIPTGGSGLSALQDYLVDAPNSLAERSLTGDQVRSALASETVEEAASDDAIEGVQTRITDARTSITSVHQEGVDAEGINSVAAGETMVVEGTTNLQPEDNTITVELANNETSVALASVDEWGTEGQWSVNLSTEGASTGTYTLDVDDGENTISQQVQLQEQVETPTEEPANETATETETVTETAAETETVTETEVTETETTEGGGPGFGLTVALIALLAAALLAVRRD